MRVPGQQRVGGGVTYQGRQITGGGQVTQRLLDRVRRAGRQDRPARQGHAVRDDPLPVTELADVGDLHAELLDQHPQRSVDALLAATPCRAQQRDERLPTTRRRRLIFVYPHAATVDTAAANLTSAPRSLP